MYKINDKRFKEGSKEYIEYTRQLEQTKKYQDKIKSLKQNRNLDREPVNVKWTHVKGVRVKRVGESKYVAVKNGSKFDIINIDLSEYVCQLTSKNVNAWLIRMAE